jgi:hypothetical protein
VNLIVRLKDGHAAAVQIDAAGQRARGAGRPVDMQRDGIAIDARDRRMIIGPWNTSRIP